MEITLLDYLVFFIFVGGVALFGCSFYFRSRKGAAAFTAAEGSLPTWVVGMSIFATFEGESKVVARLKITIAEPADNE